jgi:hypothetical protein
VAAKSSEIDPIEKIARLLAINVSKGLDNEKAARRLLAAGFDSSLIGGLLGVGPNFANVAKIRKPKPKTKVKG